MQGKLIKSIFAASALLLSCVAGATEGADHPKLNLCASCHGANGISAGPKIPNLAGQKKEYLVKALGDFKSGDRNNPIMKQIAEGLSDEDISALTTYFSSKKVTVD